MLESGGPFIQYWCPYKKRREPYIGRRPCEDKQRWCDASPSQGPPTIANSHQKLQEKHETDSSSQPSGRTNSANTLIWDFHSPDSERINFSCFQPPSLWYLFSSSTFLPNMDRSTTENSPDDTWRVGSTLYCWNSTLLSHKSHITCPFTHP